MQWEGAGSLPPSKPDDEGGKSMPNMTRSQQLFAEAVRLLPGGVNPPRPRFSC